MCLCRFTSQNKLAFIASGPYLQSVVAYYLGSTPCICRFLPSLLWSWVVVLLIVSQELLQQTICLTTGGNVLNLEEKTPVKIEVLCFNRGF
jgi:hypothetical protein